MGSAYVLGVEGWERIALGTENDRFKARYDRYLKVAVLISVVAWANVFVFTPEIEIDPYQLKEELTTVVTIVPTEVLPPPPEKLASPPMPMEPALDHEVDDDVQIFDSMPIDFSDSFQMPGAGSSPMLDFEAFDTKPQLAKLVPPVYSEFAREAGFSGVVYVDVLVGTDGRVKQTRLRRGAHPLLDRAALEAAQRARFTPGKQRDIPVEVWVTLPYSFTLN